MTQVLLAFAIAVHSFQAPPASDISEKDALEFARLIEKDHAEARPKALDDLIEIEALLDSQSADLELTPKEKADFLAGYREGSIGQSIGSASGFALHYLRTRRVEGRTLLRFRLSSTGVTYLDFELRRTPSGLKIADLFVFANGEWLRGSVRRALMAVAAADPKRRGKMPEWATDWVKNLASMQEFMQEGRTGDAAKALALFNRFPDSIKKDRMIQTIRITAAARVGDAEYLKATAEYLRLFPDDGYRDIPCLDALILRKDYPKALESIDRIDRLVEGDPMLDLIRGRIHLQQGKTAPAREAGERAFKALASLADPHWFLIEVCLLEKKFEETVARLKAVEKAFGLEIQFAAIESEPAYAEFAKSPAYLEWKKSRAPK